MLYLKQTLKTPNLFIIILLSSIVLSSCGKKPLYISKIEGKQIEINATVPNDSITNNFILPYREHLEKEMNIVLAYAPEDLTKDRHQNETPLGNFLADLCYHQAQPVFQKRTGNSIDFVLLNIGGIRTEISKGNVKVQHAFEVMPFENNMVVASLDYQSIQELLTYLAESGSAHPISKQLRVVFENNKVKEVTLNQNPLNPDKIYYVLTSDYLINGGDSMNFFKKSTQNIVLDYKIRDALIDELKEIDTIPIILDKRMIRN